VTAPSAQGGGLREALIDAASSMLLEARPAAPPSLRAVARACGVSATAVYLHFDSWSALIDAVLSRHFADARAYVDAAARAAGSPRERLEATAQAYAAWGVEHHGPYQLLFESTDWVKDSDETAAWLGELTGTMAADLLAIGAVREREAALDRTGWLLTALHGIVSIRRRKREHQWRHTVAEEVAGMVGLFAAASPA
jgi:AcrR family transcriptional regulator